MNMNLYFVKVTKETFRFPLEIKLKEKFPPLSPLTSFIIYIQTAVDLRA